MNDCTPEFWTLRDIKDSLEKEWNGKKKIVIPMFQRGKRWDKDKKETFIDSLRKRYPIGTLLFYKTVDGQQETYTLIDGLQRGTCVREYLSTPSKFFKLTDIKKESLEKIYNLIVDGENKEEQIEKINNIILNYVHGLKSFDDFEPIELVDALNVEFPKFSNYSEFNKILKDDIKDLKSNYSDLSSMRIPAIVYTGDENTLPEIFERINSKGVALTEYEIYAASWPRKEFKITNDGIIEYVLKKYDTLNDTEYAIKGYNRDDKRKSKKLNSFEYVFGLSKYIQNKYSSLNFYRNLKEDETNPVAFQLLNACFNSAHNQIKNVYQIIERFMDNIDVLENALFESIEFINKCIEPIVKFKGNNRSDGKCFHTQYQIMSYISFAFRKKYDINSPTLEVLDTWKESREKLSSNIWKYYVYDILTKFWGEGGTGKIHTANIENRYFVELTKEKFSIAYDSYSESLKGRREARQVKSPSETDYVILNTIYVTSFSAMEQLSIDKFDVEHIATKKQMLEMNKMTHGDGLPISHIANLCYLPEYENRAKGASNFYQDNNYLLKIGKEKVENKLKNIEDKYSFTKREDLEFMDLDYHKDDFDALKKNYFEYLDNRNRTVKNKFLTSLGFPNEDDGEINKNAEIVVNESNFDEKFFRVTKIGKLVIETMNYLASNNKLTEDDVLELSDKKASSKLGCWLPVIVANESETKDHKGRNRYYSDRLSINGKEYFLCKEWKEDSRSKYVSWLKTKLK